MLNLRKTGITAWFLTGILLYGCDAQPEPKFDGNNAFLYLKKQCDFGPRVPGSAAHKACLDYLVQTLRLFADRVQTQPFIFTFGTDPQSATAINVIANFNPQHNRRILLCAHWDTRPWADQDPDPANHKKPVLGANDGASGTAVLLEIARLLHQQKPNIGIDIVLFDAEDAGLYNKDRSFAQGSAEFARQNRSYKPEAGILLDLIGDRDLEIYQEIYSATYAGDLVKRIWEIAQYLGIDEFIPEQKYAVFDDHIPLLEIGIPCIDIIDFNYSYWHTTLDTPDKCSAASLEKIGRIVVHFIYNF
ncbi:M28 family peptidase [candidate division KSB1 bacterium]|nr:M28 family peptidase [candidate division KSB1 bacterium]